MDTVPASQLRWPRRPTLIVIEILLRGSNRIPAFFRFQGWRSSRYVSGLRCRYRAQATRRYQQPQGTLRSLFTEQAAHSQTDSNRLIGSRQIQARLVRARRSSTTRWMTRVLSSAQLLEYDHDPPVTSTLPQPIIAQISAIIPVTAPQIQTQALWRL